MSLITQVQIYLKDIWMNGFANEASRIHPFLDRCPKVDELGDLAFYYLVKYANNANIAIGDDNIAAAQNVGSSSAAMRFNMQPSIQTGEAILPVTQLEASLRGQSYAFGSLIETEVDGMMDEFYNRRAFQLYRDSYGDRGQVASIAGNIITLVNPYDAYNFTQGNPVGASTNVTGASPRVGSSNVAAVDVTNGTVTLVSVAGITSLTANDYLFYTTEIGQFGMEGLGICTPLVAPVVGGGDSFRGQDRSVDPTRLAGSRLTAAQATGPLEQNLMKAMTYVRIVGGKLTGAATNSERAMEMRTRLGAKVRFEPGGDVTYGFNKAMFDTPMGPLEILDDPDCPTSLSYLFNEGSHKIVTLDEFVRYDETDGNWAYKKPVNNQIGVRIRSVANYCQTEPRNFAVVPVV